MFVLKSNSLNDDTKQQKSPFKKDYILLALTCINVLSIQIFSQAPTSH